MLDIQDNRNPKLIHVICRQMVKHIPPPLEVTQARLKMHSVKIFIQIGWEKFHQKADSQPK